uniref:Uncharacterized protein n=1 Tax=Nymphaea colorata TaxID=210225 RepID=A0A5K1EQU0_9MAGN
METLCVVN